MSYLTSPLWLESADDGQDFIFAQDQVLLAVDLDVGPGILAEEDLVSGLDVQRQLGAVLEDLPVADRDDLALLGLLLRGVRDDDSSLDGLFLFDTTDDQPIVKRTNLHRESSPFDSGFFARKTFDGKRLRLPGTRGDSGGCPRPFTSDDYPNTIRSP